MDNLPDNQQSKIADNDSLQADEQTRHHISWPIIHTQQELAEKALLLNNSKPIYPLQGKQIGNILISYGVIDEKTLFIVRTIQKRQQYKELPIGEILSRIGILKHQTDDLPRALLIQAGVLMVDILTIDIPSEVRELIPISHLREKRAVPVGIYNNILYLAVTDPFMFTDSAFFTMLSGMRVTPVFAPMHDIVSYINTHDPEKKITAEDTKEQFFSLTQNSLNADDPFGQQTTEDNSSDISESDSVIVNLVNQMVLHAIQIKASDIHLEMFPDGAEASIRLRRDGRIEHFANFPRIYYKAVVSRIKIIARLDISDKRRPQDGKIFFSTKHGERIDLRVSTIPTMQDIELVTIRILASGDPLPINQLGMSLRDNNIFRQSLQYSYGLILVCGPTGSGKTTTLHSALNELNTEDRKIWTAEDPVEIVQPRLCQVQINKKSGLNFDTVLRAFLRADPDVIMVGETRDRETANVVIEAAMTGHLVFSTLHTNTAAETIPRLINLEVDPYNLADTLLAIISQRLARKLCTHCVKYESATQIELEQMANEYFHTSFDRFPNQHEREQLIVEWHKQFGKNGQIQIGRPVGCNICNDGYKGRIGLYEVLTATPELKHLIRLQSNSGEYKKCAINDGMKTLKQDGIIKVLSGITDMLQIYGASY